MKIHHLKVRAFASKETLEATRELLRSLLPQDAQIEEARIEPELEGGVFTNTMYDLHSEITGKETGAFLKKILSSLDEYDFGRIMEKKDLFLDEECNFYLRLSKKEAAAGSIVLDAKDSIHVTAKIAAYPARKENALKAVDELIKEAEDERKIR